MPYKDPVDQAAACRRHYEKNRDVSRARTQKNRAALKAWVDEQKRKPCMDCGGTFPTVCMDFDHRPGEGKVGNISRLIANAGPNAVRAEIAKCDLVCANCHRIRTASRIS